ncbi:MAG: GGDEF domain-containing response regulator [Gemmatimonadaceae bacterium]
MSYLLFADDNEDMRHMVRDLLHASGHEVALASNGPSALVSVEEREPELMILDLAMPGMSGFEVCRAVKANPFTAHVPVLMLTAHGEVDYKIEGYEAGADDYLAKPFDPRELRARVAALIRLVQREGDRNPTTGLPGGRAIEKEITRRVERNEPFAVCYIDLDNFKPFADTFGFEHADSVIRETGRAIRHAVADFGGSDGFCGHIGGDDFIVVTTEAAAPSIAQACADRYRAAVSAVVGEEIVARGTFTGNDRQGIEREFPIAVLSAVVLAVEPGRWVSPSHLGAAVAEMKRRAKQAGVGTILVDAV